MNYSTAKNRRVNIIVGVNYDSDIDLVKETLLSLANDDPRTIKEITPVCYLAKINELNYVNQIVVASGIYHRYKDIGEQNEINFGSK